MGYEKNARNSLLDVSIVIPVFNEIEVIERVLKNVLSVMEKQGSTFEIIVVNDRSTDGSEETIRQVRSQAIQLIDSNYPKGKGGALKSGFDIARGKCIVMMDADGSHQAQDLPRLIDQQRKMGGLVVASRIYGGSEEYTRTRAFGNIFFTWLFGFLHGRYLSDALNGFKAFDREIYERFHCTSTGFEIEIELLMNALCLDKPITEVPSLELKRQGGVAKSKVIKDGFRFLWRIILEKFRVRIPRISQRGK